MITCSYENLTIQLDPVDTDDRVGSVCFATTVELLTDTVSFTWRRKSAWVKFEQIAEFERALRAGRDAALIDLSTREVIAIFYGNGSTWLQLSPISNRAEAGFKQTARIECEIDAEMPTRLAEAIRAFPKWW